MAVFRKCPYCGTFETDVIFMHLRCSTAGCRAYSEALATEFEMRRNRLKKNLEKTEFKKSILDQMLDDMEDS